MLPNRHGNSDSYRYGFNGKEKDDELKGEGNSYDFGARFQDPRIGRWFSTDPVIKANKSSYQFGGNSPIANVDPDGKDEFYFNFITGKIIYRPTLGPNKYYAIYPKGLTNGEKDIIIPLNPHGFGKVNGFLDGTAKGDVTFTHTNDIFITWPFHKDYKDSHFTTLAKLVKGNPSLAELMKRSPHEEDKSLIGLIQAQNTLLDIESAIKTSINVAFAAKAFIDLIEVSPAIISKIKNFKGSKSASVRGISGTSYSTEQLAKAITPIEGDIEVVKLYRGISGTEGTTGLYLTESAEYAAAYANGGQVVEYTVSRYGMYLLKNEGFIVTKTGRYTGAASQANASELLIENKEIINVFLDNSVKK